MKVSVKISREEIIKALVSYNEDYPEVLHKNLIELSTGTKDYFLDGFIGLKNMSNVELLNFLKIIIGSTNEELVSVGDIFCEPLRIEECSIDLQ